MKNKVHTRNLSIPHFYACCQNCNWKYENYRDRPQGYRKIRSHVANTGHTVSLERGFATHYYPDGEATQHSYAADGGYCARCDMKSIYDGCCINCGIPPATANN